METQGTPQNIAPDETIPRITVTEVQEIRDAWGAVPPGVDKLLGALKKLGLRDIDGTPISPAV